jgi:hypothetical protein
MYFKTANHKTMFHKFHYFLQLKNPAEGGASVLYAGISSSAGLGLVDNSSTTSSSTSSSGRI